MTKKILKATHEGDLIIGDLHIPSAVLENLKFRAMYWKMEQEFY